MLSVEQVAEIREWVGGAPDDTTLNAIFDQVLTIRDTIRRVLLTRRADMIRNPSTITVPGEYAQSTVANLKALSDLLTELELADLATEVTTGTTQPRVRRLVRDGDDEFVGR